MRKQSTVVVLEPKKKIIRKDSKDNEQIPIDFVDDESGNTISAPHPLDKPILRKVSTLIPASEMKNILGPAISTQRGYRNSTSVLLADKSKSGHQPNPFIGMRQAALKANQLVDAILTEDHRWVNVPDVYQDYKATDFVMKLDSTKLELLHESIGSMEFPDELISDTLEQEDIGESADAIIAQAIRMRERDKKLILEAYEKFSRYRKTQNQKLENALLQIREESGYEKLEVRLQERDLQLARLQRVVSQKNKFIDLITSLGSRPSADQIRAIIENSIQDDIQSLVSTLDDFQTSIEDRIVSRKKLLNEVSRVRLAFIQKLQLNRSDEDQLALLTKKENELKVKLEQIDEDLSKIRTSNAKTNETILAMDLKAASKEQALSANNMAEEQQEMESLKVMISELNAQRESDLLKIQELEKQIAEFASSQLIRMDEESDEENDDEENPESRSTEPKSNHQNQKTPGNHDSVPHITFSAKLDISDFTRQMEEIIASSLVIPPTKPLLPTEEYVQQQPETQETPKIQEEKEALRKATERAKKREKLVSEKSEKGTIETPTEANPGEQLFDEDEPFPPIDVAGYGLDLVEAQTKKLLSLIQLSSEEDNIPIQFQKRKQAEVFMVKDITEMFGSHDADDSDNESDDSQRSSKSYLDGTEIYKTRKQLEDAIQRRRSKLQLLKDFGKKLDKTLIKLLDKLKLEKKNRIDGYNTIIKSIAGDPKRKQPRILYQSEIDVQQLLDAKQNASKEQARWKKKLEDALKKPEKAVLSKRNKPVQNISLSTPSASILETLSSDSDNDDVVGPNDSSNQEPSLLSSEGAADAVSLYSQLEVEPSSASYQSDEVSAPSNPHILFDDDNSSKPPIEILERGYSQDLMRISVSESEDGVVDVVYEPDTQRNNRLESLVKTASKPPMSIESLIQQPNAAHPKLPYSKPPREGKNSLFYNFGDSHEFIHVHEIDEILKSRKKSLQMRRMERIKEQANDTFSLDLQGTRVEIREQSRERSPRSRSPGRDIRSAELFPEPSQATQVTLDSLQMTDELLRNLGSEMIASAPVRSPGLPLHSLKKQLDATLKPSRRQFYEIKRHPLVSADITDESEYEPEVRPPLKRSITFNAPRVCRGEYTTPNVVNILDSISEKFPTTSPLIASFHAGGLKVDRKATQGVFLRSDNSPRQSKNPIVEQDENISAVDLFSKSIVTRHLIGRSTWDRVVGMHSDFAKSFIASKLKDTRLVFVVNTAGSRKTAGSPVEPLSPTPEESTSYLKSPDFETYMESQNSSSLPVVRIPLSHPSSEYSLDKVPSVGQLHLNLHEPTTPKPSFSPRKKSGGVRYNPSIIVPLM